MKLTIAAALSGAVAALEHHHHQSSSNPAHDIKIPSSQESAVMGRRILALSKLATLSTVYPANSDDAPVWEHRPEGMAGVPIGMMDYYADCEDQGNPTILAIKIATTFKNVDAGSNITLSLRWTPRYPPARRMGFFSRLSAYLTGEYPYNSSPDSVDGPDPAPYSAANLPRFSLFGYLEPIEPDPISTVKLAACFTDKHHDAKWWLPGNGIHKSEWARLVVTQVYWVGGFGDRAYIGWIPIDEWKNVTKEEWSSIKLPGEKPGWNEWKLTESEEL